MLQAFLVVLAITLLARLVGVGKEMTVAAVFGAGDALDAFLIALLLPASLAALAGGALAPALVPVLLPQLDGDAGRRAAARRMIGAATTATVLLALALTALLAAAAPLLMPVVAAGFGPPKRALTLELLLSLLTLLPLAMLGALWAAVLQAARGLAELSAAPAFVPAATAAAALLVGGPQPQALVWGTVAGFALQGLFLAASVARRGLLAPPLLAFAADPGLRRASRQFGMVLAGAALMTTTELVDLSMAAMLEPGSVASLNFGGRITAFAVSIGAFALGAVALPHFSQLATEGGWPALAASLRRQFAALAVVTLPATALLVLLAEPLVRLLFERGSFDAADTALVAATHAFYALQIPFALAGTLVVRAISAVGANHILISAAAINLGVNIGLNLLFMRWLGAPGIALSTACVYFVSTAYCLFTLRRTMRRRARLGAG